MKATLGFLLGFLLGFALASHAAAEATVQELRTRTPDIPRSFDPRTNLTPRRNG